MKAQFEKIKFVTSSGGDLDISDFVAEVNIYQSIFDHYMRCEVMLRDSVDIASAMPQDEVNRITGGFTGGEMIILEYGSEENVMRTHAFMLYERFARSKQGAGTEAYILAGVSPEGFESFPRKISRAFGRNGGSLVSSMVEKVCNDYVFTPSVKSLYDSLRKDVNASVEKILSIEPTSGLQQFIIPNMTVDDALEFLCNEADSDDHIPQYYFFENHNGFNFFNLSTLAQYEPTMTYTYTDFNVAMEDRDQKRILSYRIDKETNILENARDGLYASKVINVDIWKKKTTTVNFDYAKARSKFKGLQTLYHKGEVSTPDVNVTMMTSRAGHDTDGQAFVLEGHHPKRINQFLSSRRSYTKHIFNTKITISVPGTTVIDAGDTVQLQFPRKKMLEGPAEYDTQLSGKYIVAELRNRIANPLTSGEFVTTMTLVKDTQVLGE